jgi:hypothetical protein
MKPKSTSWDQFIDALYDDGWRAVDVDTIENIDKQLAVFFSNGVWHVKSLATKETFTQNFKSIHTAVIFCVKLVELERYVRNTAAHESSINN